MPEHFVKLIRVLTYVNICGPFTIDCTSLFTVRSGVGAVNNNLLCHGAYLLMEKQPVSNNV